MTERQVVAYTVPCARAYDTINDRFHHVYRAGRHVYSTILTVNK